MKQVLLAFEFFVYFSIYLYILQGAVEDYQNFRVDGPVVQVRYVPLEYELKCP